MSLRVIYHSRIEVLADALFSSLRAPGNVPESPFTPLKISVPDSGTSAWLHQRLATRLGVAAHVELDFPNSLINSLMSTGQNASRPWQDAHLDWAVLSVLDSVLESDDPGFAPVRRYLEQTERQRPREGALGRSSVALAHELAALFDRYVAYRPDTMRRWSRGDLNAEEQDGSLAWQPKLWSAVLEVLGAPARLSATTEETTPGPIRFFGPTDFSTISLEHLQAIALDRDVEVYCLVHSSQALAQIQDDHLGEWAGGSRRQFDQQVLMDVHSFYASSGPLERDLLISLSSIGARPEVVTSVGSTSESLGNLGVIQEAIRGGQHVPPRPFIQGDGSFSIHRCHGARRQVEILQDLLRHRLDDDETLQPRDVLVLVPKMTEFAPIIDAVFLTGDGGSEDSRDQAIPQIPYSIVGQGVRRLNPIADVLLRVLRLGGGQGRFEATVILDLLSFDPVLSRFGLSQDDVNTIQGWVVEAGIRWGMDGSHHADFCVGGDDLPADDQNSWKFGLERLLLGVVIADEDDLLFDGEHGGEFLPLRPIDDMEGARSLLVGRFTDFVNTLMVVVEELSEARSPCLWFEYILGDGVRLGLLSRIMESTEESSRHLRRAMATLSELQETARDREGPLITVEGISGFLEHKLDSVERTRTSARSSVTFAPIHSHARVPARFVVMLGFDAEVFPRGPRHQQFDLTVKEPRVGDKGPGVADRGRFLDAVMSARESLAVLYTGFDLHTNEEIPPSTVVSELCDVACSALAAEADAGSRDIIELVTEDHPLQAFSPRAFHSVEAQAWSYDPNLLVAAQASLSRESEPWCFFARDESEELGAHTQAEVPEIIRLDELLAFFKDPGEQYLRRQLKMYSPRGESIVMDREPIELAVGLEQWSVRDAMMNACLSDTAVHFDSISSSLSVRRQIATGTLPWGGQGERVLRAAYDGMQTSLDKAREVMDLESALGSTSWSDPEDIDLEFLIDGKQVRLIGRLDTIRNNYLVCLNASSSGAHRLASAWLKGLVFAVAREVESTAVVTCFLGGRSPKIEAYVPSELEERLGTSPRRQLEHALRTFLDGITRPIPLFGQLSHDIAWGLRAHQLAYDEWWTEAVDPNRDKQRLRSLSKAKSHWAARSLRSSEGMLFGGWEPIIKRDGYEFFDRDLYERATEFWWPAFATRRTATKIAGCV